MIPVKGFNMIELSITQENGTIPVTVLHLQGKLDGSNYGKLVEEGQKLYNSGARDLVIDLGGLTFLSSAGISALHQVALLFQGRQQDELEQGWHAYHAIERDLDSGIQRHVKLLNPTDEVQKILTLVGFDAYFEVYTELKGAVSSFH